MKTECVTKVWEFYRDNCAGYKEPMRKQLRELDEHVDHIAAENDRLREQVASFIELSQDMVIYAGQNMKRHFAKRLRKLGVPL